MSGRASQRKWHCTISAYVAVTQAKVEFGWVEKEGFPGLETHECDSPWHTQDKSNHFLCSKNELGAKDGSRGACCQAGRALNAKLRGLSLPTGCGSEAASSPRFAVLFSDSGCDGEAGWGGRETLVGGHDSISGDGVAAGTRWEKREQGQVSRMWSLDVEGQSTAQ